jgi:hypothetical protein
LTAQLAAGERFRHGRIGQTAPADAGCAANNALRHVEIRPLLMPYSRATSMYETPGSKLFVSVAALTGLTGAVD